MRGVTSRSLALDAAITAACWLGGEAAFALGDGAVAICAAEGAPRRIAAHAGAILCAAAHPDGARILTGGDDGRLNAVSAAGDIEALASSGGKWVDHVVASPASGVIVAGIGREAIVFKDGAESHRFAHPSSIGGMALDAKGRRLATSHYNGATMRYVLAADDKGTVLQWAGSHLAATLSPDAGYLITAMQENALHGWRLPDKTDLRMDGYPAKTRSFAWDRRGRWLATSGANAAIVWPFAGKLGPQGKAPLQLCEREALISAVAFHPLEEVLAIGYSDGACMLTRLADGSSLTLAPPAEGAVAALAWSSDGKKIAIGDEAGRATLAAPA